MNDLISPESYRVDYLFFILSSVCCPHSQSVKHAISIYLYTTVREGFWYMTNCDLRWEECEARNSNITQQKHWKSSMKDLWHEGFRSLWILLKYSCCKLLCQSLFQPSVNQAKDTEEKEEDRYWRILWSFLLYIYSFVQYVIISFFLTAVTFLTAILQVAFEPVWPGS